jgi:hypothetical protein
MTNQASRSPHNVLRWTFRYGTDLLTCGVDRRAGTRYVLSIVPNGGPAMLETFDSSVAALRRHAVITACLRDHGWVLVAYTGVRLGRGAKCRRAA